MISSTQRPRRGRSRIMTPLGLAVAATLLASACGAGTTSRPSSSMITRLDAKPATSAQPVRIMPLGDSLTRGDGPQDPTRPQSYRGFLIRALTDAGYAVDSVGSDQTPTAGGVDADNEGHGGYTIGPDQARFCTGCDTSNLSDHVAQWLSTNPADVVLLLAGINDLLPVPTATANGLIRPVDPAQAGTKLQALVQRIRTLSPTTTVLVASQPPMPFVAGNATLQAAYTSLNQAAAAAGKGDAHVVYVPLNEQLTATWNATTDTQADGLHPTPAGAEKIAKAWFTALKPVLDQPGR